jgi:hypothetical protein
MGNQAEAERKLGKRGLARRREGSASVRSGRPPTGFPCCQNIEKAVDFFVKVDPHPGKQPGVCKRGGLTMFFILLGAAAAVIYVAYKY